MPTASDMTGGWRIRLQRAGEPGLLVLGAVLLICAPVLPGLSRLVLLPALLLSPGYAFMRLLGREVEWRAISIAAPVSAMLVICTSLALYVSGIRLERLSLGPVLGAITALFLAGSYRRELLAARHGLVQRGPSTSAPPQPDEITNEHDVTFPR